MEICKSDIELEEILLKELACYMLYQFESNLEVGTVDDDVLHSVVTALCITLGKFHHFKGSELNNYVNLKVYHLFISGFSPVVPVDPVVQALFLESLRLELV